MNHYERWDGYLQSSDEATYLGDDGGRSTGKSQRFYDKNGQLQDAVDEQGVNTIHYINSTLDGLKIRQDKDGRTNYLTIGGKTIGDVHRNEYGTQRLTVLLLPGVNNKPNRPVNTRGNDGPRPIKRLADF